MSVIYYWPIGFVKHWVLPISYIVGLVPEGYTVDPVKYSFSADFVGGRITAFALFPEPVMAVYAYSQLDVYYTNPITISLDYPALGVFLYIDIAP